MVKKFVILLFTVFNSIVSFSQDKELNEIDIISDDNDFRIEKVPCKIIYEIASEDENYTPIQLYKVGIQFDEIEPKKIDNLVHFINDLNDYL